MSLKSYTVLRERVLFGIRYASPGDVVYEFVKYDYGLAADDTIFTGVKHVSVTREPNDVSSFTIPLSDLREIAGC
jgi:hypothetical protein